MKAEDLLRTVTAIINSAAPVNRISRAASFVCSAGALSVANGLRKSLSSYSLHEIGLHMKKYQKSHEETFRLQSLHSLKILDAQPDDRYDRITRLATRLFDVPIAMVSLFENDQQWLRSQHGFDAFGDSPEISFFEYAMAQDNLLVIEDARNDEKLVDNTRITSEPNFSFFAGYPLKSPSGIRLGTFCIIDGPARRFSGQDAEALQEMGQMVEAELRTLTQTTTDELTLISNRRGFTAIASHVLKICRRLKRTATLLMFDLDGFKSINDQFGHQAGDQALVEFAKLLLKNFRDADVIARLGGDEFCILCTDLELVNVPIALDRLQRKIDEFNSQPDNKGQLRFSVGTVELDSDRHASIDDLIHDADLLMYGDKRERRKMRSKAGAS